MKKVIRRAVPLAAALAIGVAGPAGAASFADIISSNLPTGGGPQTFDITMNGATVTSAGASFTDTNGNGIFDGTEVLTNSVHVFDRNGVQVLGSGPGSIGWTPAQLNQWALQNALIILEALFPGGISEMTGASDDDMIASATVGHHLFKKATVARKGQGEGKGHEVPQEVRAEVEYIDLEVAGDNGKAYGLLMGYDSESASGLNLSLAVPYRYSKMDDDASSKSHFFGLDFAAKKAVREWGKSEWTVGGDLFASLFYLKSDAIDKAGNLKYGGGLFTAVNTDLGFGNLGVGIDYKIAKAYLPDSLNSDNTFLDAAVSYLNDLDPVHTVSYGFNFGVPVGEVAAVNLEVIRASFISGDVPDGQENRTTVSLAGTYMPTDTFELNMAIRSDFELEDVDTLGIMLGMVKKF